MNREERRKFARDNAIPISGLKKVGRRLPGVSIGTPESRFAGGMPLQEQVDEVVRQVQQQQFTPRQQGHVPVVAPIATPTEGWGVFCLRCTELSGTFMYPCLEDSEVWPPQVLVAYDPSPSEV